ncbi:MAG: alcohol dehydrogenase catalytic domain-containing protein [Acidimicrobiaceae bacterium]|nr:alcohol dehydrogenase catalytic domain-containing protein [Acidimicrobiaceae bacterium]
MRALMYGVEPEVQPVPETDNRLLQMLARTPTKMVDIDEPGFLRRDWVVTRPRLVGICGSESKAVFLDYASLVDPANATDMRQHPMKNFVSTPHVMGHEVIAEVVAVGPEAEGLEPGDRVALNPWLTCVTRGVAPICPACEAGNLSQCHSFGKGAFSPGIHIGMCTDVNGGFAELMPAHDSMLFKVPDGLTDEQVVFADPFAVSLRAVTRHPPQPGSKVLVYGAGALALCAIAILRALHPTVEVMAVARFESQRQLAETLGAVTVPHEPRLEVIERVAAWSGGVLQPADGLPMAFPGGVEVVYDTIGAAETLEVGCRVLAAHGTLAKLGMHGSAKWEDTPVYCKELTYTGSNAFGIEEVEGVRKHGIAHFLEMVGSGLIDLAPMLTHTFRLEQWREAFTALADQAASGAIKVAFDNR